MSAWAWSSIGVAALLGARHGLDADHLAAIDGLSRLSFGAGRPRLARWSGVLFAAGHGAVVLAAAVLWSATGASVPGWLDGLGSVLSIGLLMVLGLANLRLALLGEGRPPRGLAAARLIELPGVRNAAGGLVVGALFALSFDTLTIAAWLGAAGGGAAGASAALPLMALAFVAGMMACDGANGWWIAHLIGRSRAFAAGARRLFAALVAGTALAVAAVGIVRLELPSADRWFDAHGLWTGVALAAVLLGAYTVLRRWRPAHPLLRPARSNSGLGAAHAPAQPWLDAHAREIIGLPPAARREDGACLSGAMTATRRASPAA